MPVRASQHRPRRRRARADPTSERWAWRQSWRAPHPCARGRERLLRCVSGGCACALKLRFHGAHVDSKAGRRRRAPTAKKFSVMPAWCIASTLAGDWMMGSTATMLRKVLGCRHSAMSLRSRQASFTWPGRAVSVGHSAPRGTGSPRTQPRRRLDMAVDLDRQRGAPPSASQLGCLSREHAAVGAYRNGPRPQQRKPRSGAGGGRRPGRPRPWRATT